MLNDLVIIKCNKKLSTGEMIALRQRIKAEKASGTIILPYYCDAIYAPEDIAVKIMNDEGEVRQI